MDSTPKLPTQIWAHLTLYAGYTKGYDSFTAFYALENVTVKSQ
jgi:hypothetical protein